jgi:glycosyltransferase involved in cell wall biosynthesis
VKLAVLFDNFGPYHLARLKAVAAEVDLLALECFARSRDYGWNRPEEARDLPSVTLFAADGGALPGPAAFAGRISAELRRFAPDVVAVPGWSSRAAFSLLACARAAGVPAVAMSESTARDEPRVFLKEAVKRRVARLYAAALVGGAPHARYAAALGFPEAALFTGYDAVDNAWFMKAAEDRRRKGSPPFPAPFFLASNRFIAKKNLPRLLNAYARYRAKAGTPWALVLLGDGPMRPEIEAQAARLGLAGALHMPGFVQYEALPDYYAFAGAFIHASTSEQWGLVVNEAMASGLPVIVSNRCGCCEDLVEDGVNGFTFDPFDEDRLATLMARMAADRCDRQAMGEAGRGRIGKWGPEAFAEGLKKAASYALGVPRRPLQRVDAALLRILARR